KSSHKKVASATAPTRRSSAVSLLDGKRTQNVSIALARVRVPFEDIRKRIAVMEVTEFTGNQLTSLQECLPCSSEKEILLRYSGPKDSLGVAEKFMCEMLKLPLADDMMSCMMFQMHFHERLDSLRSNLGVVTGACTELMRSGRLKKVLKVILKVTNQLNAGHEPVRGIAVDSLLKLRQLKSADRKTSVLQYVFQLLQKHDASCLEFFDELSLLEGAARAPMEGALAEQQALQDGVGQAETAVQRVVEWAQAEKQQGGLEGLEEVEVGAGRMMIFLKE
ncbi:FH13, partial [Symbiodinium microadriaticum]